jgi:hypothetical protein
MMEPQVMAIEVSLVSTPEYHMSNVVSKLRTAFGRLDKG